MFIKPIRLIIGTLGILLMLTSCVKDPDYSVVETIGLNSIITSNLLKSSHDAASFFDVTSPGKHNSLYDSADLEILSSDGISKQLKSVYLSFILKNSLNRDVMIDFEFLTETNDLIYTLQIPVSAGTIQTSKIVETNISIQEPELNSFKTSTKLVVKSRLILNSKEVLSESEGLLSVKAAATYSFDRD